MEDTDQEYLNGRSEGWDECLRLVIVILETSSTLEEVVKRIKDPNFEFGGS